MNNATSISIDTFRALALQHAGEKTTGATPYTLISRQMPADLDTPVSALLKLRHGEHSFLLESVERGNQVGRYSFLGTDPQGVLTARSSICKLKHRDGSARGEAQEETECKAPLDKLEALLSARKLVPPPDVEMPRFSGGAVGYAGYEVVCSLEPVQPAANDPLGLPDMAFAFYDTVVVFDHVQRTAQVITLAPLTSLPEAEYARALERIEAVMQRLRRPAPLAQATQHGTPDPTVTSNQTQAEFERLVGEAKEHIAAGDIIQVVLSQRFQRRTTADPFNIYRALRTVNPSPYMFFLQFGSLCLIGASPEMLVRVQKGKVSTHPIAGTRPRGQTTADDARLEQELMADEKERAEHLMLVDLARNDVGRIAKIGSVKVPRFMQVDRYSHVMHIVSEVEAELQDKLGPVDVLRACFPAGTVSGAPKVRAMQIISQLERDRRGPYSGAAGYIGYDGNMDTAITIRTVVIKDGAASVQAGAGIVADSVPASEYAESRHKAGALLSAISLAEQIEQEASAEQCAPEREEVAL